MSETLRLIPAPTDVEIRKILAEHDWSPELPDGAINFRVIAFRDGRGKTVHQMSWREVNQFSDDPLSGGKPEIDLIRVRIDAELATKLESVGLPTLNFINEAQAKYYLKHNLRTGFEKLSVS